MASLTIAGDTSGSITLSAPSVAGSNVLSLPASTGTVLTTGSPQSGGVIQTVQGTYASSTSTTTSTYVDSGLTVNITPKFSTSSILIIAYCGQCIKTANNLQMNFQIVRAGSSIFTGSALNTSSASTASSNPTFVYLDSPATTSSTTYKVQFSDRDNVGTVTFNLNGTATIILMEIAA